jgi:thiol-disulfide isomerase/thioredoxin
MKLPFSVTKRAVYLSLTGIFSTIAFIATVAGLFFIFSDKENTKTNKPSSDSSNSVSSQKSFASLPSAGKYADYKGFDIKVEADKLPNPKVILFFSTPECPTCLALDRDINRELAQIPPTMIILKVDMATNQDVVEKYKVLLPNTFVQIDGDQKELRKWDYSYTFNDLVKEQGNLR